MGSPCHNSPCILTPFRIDGQYGIVIEICHHLGKFGTMDCKKVLSVKLENGGKLIGNDAEDIMAVARQGYFSGVRNDKGRIVAPSGSSRPSLVGREIPPDFTEPKEVVGANDPDLPDPF